MYKYNNNLFEVFMATVKKKPATSVTKPRDTQNAFTFAVEKELKDAFVNSCIAMDSTASRELRQFMRQYLAKHGQQKLI
jgi:hypothetical protein